MPEQFEAENISQSNYEETPYEDASWEIVDQLEENPQFAPMELPVLPGQEFVIDPMFANYGGIPEKKTETRWHCPQDEMMSSETPEERRERELSELRAEYEAKIEAARQEGMELGRAEGMEAAVEQNTERLSAMESAIRQVFDDIQKQVNEALVGVEKSAVELSLQIAQKLVGTAVEINPEYIVEIVKEAIDQTGTAIVKKVRVSAEDLEFIDVLGVRKLIKEYDGSWDFEADDAIRSGCVVETSAGEIDYQLDVAWNRIKENVVKVVR